MDENTFLSEDVFKVLTKQITVDEFQKRWGNNITYFPTNASMTLVDKENESWTISID